MALPDAAIFMDAPWGILALAGSERTIEPPPAKWAGNKLNAVRIVRETISANVAATSIATGKSWNTYFIGNSPQALGAIQVNAAAAVATDGLFTFAGYPLQPPERAELAVATSLEVQQLRRDFEALASEVRKLAVGEHRYSIAEVVAAAPRGYRALTLNEMKAELGAQIAGDAWLDLFDYAAAAETTISPVVLEAAKQGLGSDDPAVRSVAGRALVASGDAGLMAQVREVVEHEPNALVAHTLRSALRGATA